MNAGYIRNEINDELDCIHSPIPENYAHSLIISKTLKISESKSRAMAGNAALVYLVSVRDHSVVANKSIIIAPATGFR